MKRLIIIVIALLNVYSFSMADETVGAFDERAEIPINRKIRNKHPQKITKTLDGITFFSDYDNGSLADVVAISQNVFSCAIYSETGVSGEAQYWFRFQMFGVAGRTITLNINHAKNPRPVISFDGVSWRRMTAAEAPNTASVVFTFDPEQDFAEIAFFFPAGLEEIYQKTSALVRRHDYVTSEIIGLSEQKRQLWMVSATNPSAPDSMKHRVWVHSRVHAGEATATHVMLGFLEQITEDSPLGERLRQFCIFNVVPVVNVDGVYLGHTRWDSLGRDIERGWCPPVVIPETLALKNQVDPFMAGSNPIEVALNLHSTVGSFKDTFFFKHTGASVTRAFEAIQQRFIDAFDNATPLFDSLSAQTCALAKCRFIESYFWNNWGENVMAMTHEGHFFRRITDNEWITDDDYRALGRAMAACLVEYFELPQYAPQLWMLN